MRFICGFLVGAFIVFLICGGIYDTRKIDHRVELYSVASREYRKGFKTGEQWGIELQRHKELMERGE